MIYDDPIYKDQHEIVTQQIKKYNEIIYVLRLIELINGHSRVSYSHVHKYVYT